MSLATYLNPESIADNSIRLKHLNSDVTDILAVVNKIPEIYINGDENLTADIRLRPNIYYNIKNMAYGSIAFEPTTDGEMCNFMFQIEIPDNLMIINDEEVSPSIILPDDIKWSKGLRSLVLSKGKTYQISVINNLGVYTEY